VLVHAVGVWLSANTFGPVGQNGRRLIGLGGMLSAAGGLSSGLPLQRLIVELNRQAQSWLLGEEIRGGRNLLLIVADVEENLHHVIGSINQCAGKKRLTRPSGC
jgi:hypothetical protein